MLRTTDGILVEQVDFDYPEAYVRYSSWGRLTVDPRRLRSTGVAQGFLNIYTDAGWVVQNLYFNADDGLGPITTYFDLGLRSLQPVQRLDAFVTLSSTPTTRFTDGPRITFPVSPTVESTGGVGEEQRPSTPSITGQAVATRTAPYPTITPLPELARFVRNRTETPTPPSPSYRVRPPEEQKPLPAYDEQRRQRRPQPTRPTYPDAVDTTPPYLIVAWFENFPTWTTTLPNSVNVQSAVNQCVPMAVANSLQFLESTYGIQIPHQHAPGINGDNTLVGQLDKEMGRNVTNRKNGSGTGFQPMLNGKFSYLSKNGLTGFFTHKHQGRGWGKKALPTGDYTSSGITSEDEGAVVTWEWICDEIKKGEDVELIYSRENATGSITGGHAVRVFECGQTLGVPWIGYLHDKNQKNDNAGLETVRQNVVDIDGDGLLNFGAATREVQFALAESPAPGMSISQAQPMTYNYEQGTGWS